MVFGYPLILEFADLSLIRDYSILMLVLVWDLLDLVYTWLSNKDKSISLSNSLVSFLTISS
jgi:hypothetical protein